MDRALLVIDDDLDPTFVKRAARLAGGVDAELLVIKIVDEGEYQGRVKRAATKGEDIENVEEAEEAGKQEAAAIVSDALTGIDVSYRTDGVIGRLPDAVLKYAEEYGCDHVFISGPKRTPTGKAVFGDTTQAIILQFDGLVTVNVS